MYVQPDHTKPTIAFIALVVLAAATVGTGLARQSEVVAAAEGPDLGAIAVPAVPRPAEPAPQDTWTSPFDLASAVTLEAATTGPDAARGEGGSGVDAVPAVAAGRSTPGSSVAPATTSTTSKTSKNSRPARAEPAPKPSGTSKNPAATAPSGSAGTAPGKSAGKGQQGKGQSGKGKSGKGQSGNAVGPSKSGTGASTATSSDASGPGQGKAKGKTQVKTRGPSWKKGPRRG